MELFAGLMFDRIWITLEPIDMALQELIFALKALQLVVESLGILPLLLVGRETILTEDDVVSHA